VTVLLPFSKSCEMEKKEEKNGKRNIWRCE
jgi:hypothetical protein